MTRDFFVRQGIFSTESCRIPRKYYQTSPKELLEKYDIADWRFVPDD